MRDNEEGAVRFPDVGPDTNNLDTHLAGAVVEDEPEMVHLLTTAATDDGSVDGGGSVASAHGVSGIGDGGGGGGGKDFW